MNIIISMYPSELVAVDHLNTMEKGYLGEHVSMYPSELVATSFCVVIYFSFCVISAV